MYFNFICGDFDLQVLTMDVNKHILKGDYHFTNEKVICLDLCQDILVATASGSLYMRGMRDILKRN
jgi:hypothetical protein